jgi:L-aspartate oxidase
MNDIVSSDVVIVGSGVAGLSAALYAVGRRVTIVSKSSHGGGGSSVHAQGGVAVALGPDDDPRLHAADTLDVGCGLGDPEVVSLVTAEGPQRVRALVRLGAELDRTPAGELELGREAAHSRRRVVHADGDATGAELVRALAAAVQTEHRIRIDDQMLALELVREGGRVAGVLAVDRSGAPSLYRGRAVVLATGGVGYLYRRTTNPAEATGDGLAMAARAGARLAGLELVQFHPTALADGSDPMALLTEALRGEGATLIDETGARFMLAVHRLGELAPRDVVARAIWRHRRDGHQAFLDARSLAAGFAERFPTVLRLCRERGLDPVLQPIPVAPAAHYHMGGVVVDQQGRSSLPGLWACGEVAFTGLHGANRLASNSLLEALVYGARIGEALAAALPEVEPAAIGQTPGEGVGKGAWLANDAKARDLARGIREAMWRGVGVERTASSLDRTLRDLRALELEAPVGPGELANMLTVASLITRAAYRRTESRGSHFRSDFPCASPHWRQQLVFEGEHLLEPHPVAVAG